MKPLTKAALIVLLLAIIMTGIGGLSDILSSGLRITKEHAWNDGIFLAIVAVVLLLLDLVI